MDEAETITPKEKTRGGRKKKGNAEFKEEFSPLRRHLRLFKNTKEGWIGVETTKTGPNQCATGNNTGEFIPPKISRKVTGGFSFFEGPLTGSYLEKKKNGLRVFVLPGYYGEGQAFCKRPDSTLVSVVEFSQKTVKVICAAGVETDSFGYLWQ